MQKVGVKGKAALHGTIFAYDYRARLAYVWLHYRSCCVNAHDIRTTHVDVISENCARVGGQKWWRILVAHDIRKQKSYCLNRPLGGARSDRTKETKI